MIEKSGGLFRKYRDLIWRSSRPDSPCASGFWQRSSVAVPAIFRIDPQNSRGRGDDGRVNFSESALEVRLDGELDNTMMSRRLITRRCVAGPLLLWRPVTARAAKAQNQYQKRDTARDGDYTDRSRGRR
jgi:hypothetical protein